MARYFLEFAYNGTRFHGYQIQPNGLSIQEAIQRALSLLLKTETELTGCGRTDSGVHALQYYAHFNFDGNLPANLIYALNSMLKKDIVFIDVYRYKMLLTPVSMRFREAMFIILIFVPIPFDRRLLTIVHLRPM